MAKRRIETKAGAQPIGAYSQGMRVGDFIFVSESPDSGHAGGEVERLLRTHRER